MRFNVARRIYVSERLFSGKEADHQAFYVKQLSFKILNISMQLHVFYLLGNGIDSVCHEFYTDPKISLQPMQVPPDAGTARIADYLVVV